MPTEKVISQRLAQIEVALGSRHIHAVADHANRAVLVLPPVSVSADPEHLWDLAKGAPSVHLTEQELLSDEFLEIALRRATAIITEGTNRDAHTKADSDE